MNCGIKFQSIFENLSANGDLFQSIHVCVIMSYARCSIRKKLNIEAFCTKLEDLLEIWEDLFQKYKQFILKKVQISACCDLLSCEVQHVQKSRVTLRKKWFKKGSFVFFEPSMVLNGNAWTPYHNGPFKPPSIGPFFVGFDSDSLCLTLMFLWNPLF